MRYLLTALVFVLFAACEKEEITQSDPIPITSFAKQLASPEFLDPLVEGLGQMATLTDAFTEEGPATGKAALAFHHKAEALVQEAFSREEVIASRDALLSYVEENSLSLEDVAESVRTEAENILRQRQGLPRQSAQKGLPCYEAYKDRIEALTIGYAVCLGFAVPTGGGYGAAGCTATYAVGLYAADVAYNTCVDEI